MITSFTSDLKSDSPSEYSVKRLKTPLTIDANWDKPQWKKIKEIPISNFMGDVPAFRPVAKAKMMYDAENLYLIFRVDDQHVRIQTQHFNGPVSGDACVEFFFSPDKDWPLRYFNLEINAGGVPLMAYHSEGVRKNFIEDDFKNVKIAHTLPGKLDKEISTPVTWVIECKFPIEVLRKYSHITGPDKGAVWKANFYKTSSRSSNPHYLTWSIVKNPTPQFHLPQFFGTLIFK
jgi:hypothetical protein